MNDLIDTTEMYLKTVFELEEEGVLPLRARIAERLGQSGPTVSQTVARMQRDGLVVLENDRHLELTESGRRRATDVMRKHRLAERLLLDVIGLPWRDVHIEACRWEHVMSHQVEERLVELLGHPTLDPYGNPIPRAGNLQAPADAVTEFHQALIDAERASIGGGTFEVCRISEVVQDQQEAMTRLQAGGIVPGAVVELVLTGDIVTATVGGQSTELSPFVAHGVHVRPVAS
ncbi:MAG: iron dependent repressor, metal binding and dimerization domain protein [Nakamurella sp.]